MTGLGVGERLSLTKALVWRPRNRRFLKLWMKKSKYDLTGENTRPSDPQITRCIRSFSFLSEFSTVFRFSSFDRAETGMREKIGSVAVTNKTTKEVFSTQDRSLRAQMLSVRLFLEQHLSESLISGAAGNLLVLRIEKLGNSFGSMA